MNIKTFVIRSVIGIVLSVIIYLGLLRYIYLHFANTEKYIEKYKSLKDASSKDKVVIVIPVNNDKINKLKPVLNSILDQTVRVNNIFIHSTEHKSKYPEIVNKVAYVAKCGQDYCEAMGIIPALLREDNKETIIIILHDNIIYGKDFIQAMVEEIKDKDKPIQTEKAVVIKPKYFKPGTVQKGPQNDKDWLLECLDNCNIDKVSYIENFKAIQL